MPQYQLVVRRGPRAGETFELKAQTVIIGRDSTADIIINDRPLLRWRDSQRKIQYLIDPFNR